MFYFDVSRSRRRRRRRSHTHHDDLRASAKTTLRPRNRFRCLLISSHYAAKIYRHHKHVSGRLSMFTLSFVSNVSWMPRYEMGKGRNKRPLDTSSLEKCSAARQIRKGWGLAKCRYATKCGVRSQICSHPQTCAHLPVPNPDGGSPSKRM
jgi:hypothetical protein